MFNYVLKNMWSHKARALATALAVILGVAFLAGTLIFGDTIQRSFDDLFSSVTQGTDAAVRTKTQVDAGFGVKTRGRIPESIVAETRKVDGVTEASGYLQVIATISDANGKQIGKSGQGPPSFAMSWGGESPISPWKLKSGRAPKGDNEAALDASSAEKYKVKLGDTITVSGTAAPTKFTVVGTASFGSAENLGGATSALLPLDAVQKIAGVPDQVDLVLVAGKDGISQDQMVSRLKSAISSGEIKGTKLESITGKALGDELKSSIASALGFLNTFILTFALISLFVSCFVISNTFSILVGQRTRELGLLRAVGATSSQIRWSVFGEALLIGLIASFAGLAAGIGLALGIQSLLSATGTDLPGSGAVVLPRTAIVAVVVGVLVTLVSAMFPALRAARVTPIEALVAADNDAAAGETNRRRRFIGVLIAVLGVAALAAGLAMPTIQLVGLGAFLIFIAVFVLGPMMAGPLVGLLGGRLRSATGTMALRNARRNPTRTARTAAALTIGVALVSSVSVLAASLSKSIRDVFEEQFQGDLAISQGGLNPTSGFSPEIGKKLAALPEISSVTNLRILLATVDGKGALMSASDPKTAFSFFDPKVLKGSDSGLGVDSIMVSQEKADETKVKVGDTLGLKLLSGKTVEVKVAAIYKNKSFLGDYFVTNALTEQASGQVLDYAVYAKLAPGYTAAQAKAAAKKLIVGLPQVQVQDRKTYVDEQVKTIDALVNLVYGLLFLAVIIAAFGIANTIRLSVLERTREIGLLRAVGGTRKQIRATIRTESVLTSALGAVQGIVIGLILGYSVLYALRDQGINSMAFPVVTLVIILVVGLLVGVIAAIRPARRAAKMDVLHAINQ